MKYLCPWLVIVLLLASSGCSPGRQKGDIEVSSDHSGILSTKQISSAIYETLYGVEFDDPNVSGSRTPTFLLTVVIVLPENERWTYTGGGSIRPWHQSIIRRRWMHYPIVYFAKPESNREFGFEYDGRRRRVRIAGENYPVRIGELIFVQFDDNWKPHVVLAKEPLEPILLSSNIGEEIERRLANISVPLDSE